VSKTGELKIIDFGLARHFTKHSKFTDVIGTPYYVAPEVLNANHGKECDMWSLGVLMYIMLSGSLPFTGGNPNEVFSKILEGKYSIDQREWDNHSEDAKDLLKKLLVVNPLKRLKPEEALLHPWFDFDDNSTN